MNDVVAETKWILVAGSGAGKIPARIVETSERLGRELANAGFGLITGGWPGVDHMTARAFAVSVREVGGRLSDRVLQVMEKGAMPDFPGGRLRIGGTEDQAWAESITLADGVVLIGGLGGTRVTGEIAQKRNKPVFPLADSNYEGHSDAYNFYFKMVGRWGVKPVQDITLDDFQRLAEPAPDVVTELIQILEKHFGQQPLRKEADQARVLSARAAASELWQERLAFMQKEEAIAVDPDMKFRLIRLIAEADQEIRLLASAG